MKHSKNLVNLVFTAMNKQWRPHPRVTRLCKLKASNYVMDGEGRQNIHSYWGRITSSNMTSVLGEAHIQKCTTVHTCSKRKTREMKGHGKRKTPFSHLVCVTKSRRSLTTWKGMHTVLLQARACVIWSYASARCPTLSSAPQTYLTISFMRRQFFMISRPLYIFT